MTKLALIPTDSISIRFGAQVQPFASDGGASRYRRDLVGANAIVRVEWILEEDDQNYLMAFYRSAADYGGAAFEIDLVGDRASIAEYTAHFTVGSLALDRIAGRTFIWTADLEIEPLVVDSAYDDALITSYEAYGAEGDLFFLSLEYLVNVWMPEQLG